MATAAWDTDVMLREMAVSVRTRLPTSRAWRNSGLSTGPTLPSAAAVSHEERTWPRISCSPMTAESRPDATAKRWRAASPS